MDRASGGAGSLALGLLPIVRYVALATGFARHASPVWDEVPTFAQGLHLLRHPRWDFPGALGAGALLTRPVRRLGMAVVLVAGSVAVSTLRTHPHDLGYVSELAGGSRHGWRRLADSNLDRGQGLKDLRAWMRERRVDRVQLAYFGTGLPEYYGSASPSRRPGRPGAGWSSP